MGRLCSVGAALLLAAVAGCATTPPDVDSKWGAPDVRIVSAELRDGSYEIVVENAGREEFRGTCAATFFAADGKRIILGRDPRFAFTLAPGERRTIRGECRIPEAVRVEAVLF